jgi:hypothetical protein
MGGSIRAVGDSQPRLCTHSELACLFCRLQGVDVFLAEDRRERPHRKQEVLGRTHEGTAVVLQHPAGDDAVHVRVVVHGLAPGVQDHDDAELAVPTILRKGLQGFSSSFEQQTVYDLRIVTDQGQQRVGQSAIEKERGPSWLGKQVLNLQY